MLQDLREASDSEVTAQSYHPTYFPPGCVLYGLEFHHGPNHFKLVEIQKLRVKAAISACCADMFRESLPRARTYSSQLWVRRNRSTRSIRRRSSTNSSPTAASLSLSLKNVTKRPFVLTSTKPRSAAYAGAVAIAYHLKFHNPNPPGEISADGKFGPYSKHYPDKTPFSGSYTFDHADLSVYGGISGILSSQGNFDGTLKQLSVTGTTATPDFRVKDSGNTFNLTTKFDAYVNGQNGDTFPQECRSAFWTHYAHGSGQHREN